LRSPVHTGLKFGLFLNSDAGTFFGSALFCDRVLTIVDNIIYLYFLKPFYIILINMNIVEKLMSVPKKDRGFEQAHIPTNIPKDFKQQIDLLYLPHDSGDKYALVAVDVGTRKCDAEPVSERNPPAIIKAITKMYKRKILNKPKIMYCDNGVEFKGEFIKYLKDNNIMQRVSKTGRHRQTSLVENKNKFIGRALFKRMLSEEMLTGEISNQWTDNLKEVVADINKKIKPRKQKVFPNKLDITPKTKELLEKIEDIRNEKEPIEEVATPQSIKDAHEMKYNGYNQRNLKPIHSSLKYNPLTDKLDEVFAAPGAGRKKQDKKEKPDKKKKPDQKNIDETYCSGDSCVLFEPGAKVRVQLDVPVDFLSGKRLIGTFRASDIRWTKQPHTITDIVIKPACPPLYIIDDDETTGYTKN
jgi:hypothetical protein